MILDEIIDHRWDVNAIGNEFGFTEMTNGIKQSKMTTPGQQLCIQWKNGFTKWVQLKETKQ